MAATDSQARARIHLVQDLLLNYLQETLVFPWPGGDGLTLDDVLAEYGRALACGQVPDPQALQSNHPELAEELASFFAQLP
jgi:hypothetical protein